MVKSLRLRNYRSYIDKSFIFGPAVNIIVGPNGSGKTNLLEALLVVCTHSSYRAKDVDLIYHNKEWARIDAVFEKEDRTFRIEREGDGSRKTLLINNLAVHRVTRKKKLPVVLFEPNELQLFSNGPDKRRDFLDELLEMLYLEYGSIRRQYRRSLSQRNRLLKTQPSNVGKQLFVWDIRLSELGGQIVAYRQRLINDFNKDLPAVYRALSASSVPTLVAYQSSINGADYSSALLHKLEQHVELDLMRGFTAYGPHRDDMQASIAGHSLQDSASRGEIRTLILAIKIIQIQMVERAYGAKALLLFDDVFSELDAKRRRLLTKLISRDHQTFITTTNADVVVSTLKNKHTIIPITKS